MKLSLATLLYLSAGANASDEGGVRGGRKLPEEPQCKPVKTYDCGRDWCVLTECCTFDFETCSTVSIALFLIVKQGNEMDCA